jgi:hypothetical protein
MTTFRFINVVCGAAWAFAGLGLMASAQEPQFDVPPPRDVWVKVPVTAEEKWPRHFRIGMLVGMNVKADFSMSGSQFPVSGSQPGGAGGGEHFYDDGYVRVDETGNAQGYTSFWGYNNACAQLRGQTLTFHSSKSFGASGSAEGNDSPYLGLDLAYGGQLGRWGPTRYGWEFGFGFLPISIEDKQEKPAVITRAVHTFDTGNILVPTDPYNGGPSGIGPTIRDNAMPQDDSVVREGTVAGSRTLDVTLYVARLGPLFHWELHPQWAASLGIGPAVGYVDGELRFDEVLVTGSGSARNAGKVTGSGFVYGGYIGATVMYHAVQGGDFYVGVQYMPLSSMSINGSGREARLDLAGGIYFSAGFNWPF